jgi:ankyrin repeat protein
MQALYTRNDDEVTRLLALEPDLDAFEAAALGKVPRLRSLVEEDPSLARAWADDGFTPLHLAACFGQLAAARWLLDAGADASAVSRNEMGVQPLHSAAAARPFSLDLCRLLLERGADPDGRQASGHMPMDEARINHNEVLERLLVEHGASA